MKNMKDSIEAIFTAHQSIYEQVREDREIKAGLVLAAQKCIDCFSKDGKVLFCGNGGSAADAQHLASELSGKFNRDRAALFAEALHVNSSYLTAVSNDYGFEHAFSRLVQAKARKGDILFGLSTSGNSANVIRAFEQARKQDVFTIAFTGESGGQLVNVSDLVLKVASNDTPRIQEMHILMGHILCELVEAALFD
jgi:D-sedoheptulose 7-phosphate isomerase